MTGTSESAAGRPALNPFLLPNWEHSPMRPLCPWTYPWHEDFYVSIDNADEAFADFRRGMGDVTNLDVDGRLVLVSGESGCGKTALTNRCAHWLRETLRERGTRGEIIDLTREGVSAQRRTVDEHLRIVSGRLCDELILRHPDLFSAEAKTDLRESRDDPNRFYPYLSGALNQAVVVMVLLPPIDTVVGEVLAYAGLARRNLVFFAESAYLDAQQIRQVERSPAAGTPPVVLRVGALNPGDVRRFVEDRLTRHKDSGRYPRISDETIASIAGPLRSVGMLQRILCGVYEDRARRAVGYEDTDMVNYQEVLEFMVKDLIGPRASG